MVIVAKKRRPINFLQEARPGLLHLGVHANRKVGEGKDGGDIEIERPVGII